MEMAKTYRYDGSIVTMESDPMGWVYIIEFLLQ